MSEENPFLQQIQEWFTTETMWGSPEWEEKARDPRLPWSELQLALMMLHGRHGFVSALLENPKIPFELWRHWCWINPDKALENLALPLWLVEDPGCLTTIRIGPVYCLLTSEKVPTMLMAHLWFSADWMHAPILRHYLFTSPSMPAEWLTSAWRSSAEKFVRHEGEVAQECMARGYVWVEGQGWIKKDTVG